MLVISFGGLTSNKIALAVSALLGVVAPCTLISADKATTILLKQCQP